MRRLTGPVTIVIAAAVLVACSDDSDSDPASSSSSSGSASASDRGARTSAPALCSSLGDLEDSLSALVGAPLQQGGIGAVQAAFTAVREDAEQVIDDARDEYAGQADQLKTDLSAVQSALDDATSSPTSATLQSLGTAIGTLTGDVTSFVGDVGSTC